jgi:thioredoxin 1
MNTPAIFTDECFETEALQSNLPVLVDFWGGGCGGFRAIALAIDVVAEAYYGKRSASST